MKKLLLGLCMAALCSHSALAADTPRDAFFWLGQINKSTDVVNTSENLLTPEEGRTFARGIDKVLQQGNALGGARPNLVITFEPYLIDAAGPQITKLHAGRSSQDMLSTVNYAMTREDVLALANALNKMQATLIKLADEQQNTIVPSYTNGVAAQPTSYGHYLLAYADAFSRDSARLQAYYKRLNRSPMGTTVLNGTGWPLNRDKMAAYLGFDDIAYNAYDAVQVYSMESPVEAGMVASTIALHIGSFIEDIMQQYAQPRPWILLKEGGGNTYVSSAMPQKRNPGILNSARRDASDILGAATTTLFRSHNIPPGMADPRSHDTNKMLQQTTALVNRFDHILNSLVINPQRSLEELNLDWTCSQEIADVLMRKYNIPFRTGHHFASEIVTYARANNIPPSHFTYADAQKIYSKLASGDNTLPQTLPMTEADFKAALDPVAIVNNRATKGGPQKAEITVMLRRARQTLSNDEAWVNKQNAKLQAAENKLNSDFNALLNQ